MTINSATAQTTIDSGYCGGEGGGTNLTWVLTNDGVLTISGSGAMANYENNISMITAPPWRTYRVLIFTLVLDERITSIGTSAFSNCTGLTSATIPNSVTSIGEAAFAGCTGLTDSLRIPSKVLSIGDYAFWGCSSLSSLTLPNSLTSIGDYTFKNCSSLTSINCEAIVPPALGIDAFFNVLSNIPVCVPSGSVADYQSSDWDNWFTNISGCAPVGITEISGESTVVTVHPNPTTDKVYLTVEGNIRIYSIQGTLLHETFGSEADLSGYPQGVYFLKVDKNAVAKVVKK